MSRHKKLLEIEALLDWCHPYGLDNESCNDLVAEIHRLLAGVNMLTDR